MKIDRDWSDAVTSQGTPKAKRSLEEARRDPLLEASEEAWACQHFDYGLLASRTVK